MVCQEFIQHTDEILDDESDDSMGDFIEDDEPEYSCFVQSWFMFDIGS